MGLWRHLPFLKKWVDTISMKTLNLTLGPALFFFGFLFAGCGQVAPHDNAPGTYNPISVPVKCSTPPTTYSLDNYNLTPIPCSSNCKNTGVDPQGNQVWNCADAAQSIQKCAVGKGQIYHTDANQVASSVCDLNDQNCCDVSRAAQASWN